MSLPPERRVIGRILSLGFPLPGVRVDNYSFISAPSFFDYDALIVDPSALSRLIEDTVAGAVEPSTFGERPVRNVPAAPDDVALADVLLRRRDETRTLLDNGGVVVCFARPPIMHTSIEGVPSLDDYYWLGDQAPPLVAADGTQAQIVDYAHPLAPLVLGQLAHITYQARVDTDAIAGFAGGGSIFCRSQGGAAIGVELPSERGRIVMLPAMKPIAAGAARYTASETMQAGIRRMLGAMAEGRAPYWVDSYTLPDLDARADALKTARATATAAQVAADAAAAEHERLDRYRRLLWQEGATGLDDVVLEALKLLGFDVYARDPASLELRIGHAPVLLEIDAAQDAVGMAAHYRLRQRIEQAIERRGSAPRGLIIINGHRGQSPKQRPQQASDALRTAAETMRYCISTTTALYEAVVAKLSGDDAAVDAYKQAITSHEGLLGAE